MPVRIWVNRVFEKTGPQEWLVNGKTFGDDLGFGDLDTRNYSGEAALISENTSSVSMIEVGLAHVQGVGMLWNVMSKISVPEVPYLIVDNASVRLIVAKPVTVTLSPHGKELLALSKKRILEYTVRGEDWFGVLCFKNEKIAKLYAFSSRILGLNGRIEIVACESQYPMGTVTVM